MTNSEKGPTMMTTQTRKPGYWTDEEEARRLGCLAAGVEPRLFHFWGSDATDRLVVARDEYAAHADLAEVVDMLDREIAYRTMGADR